MTRDQAIKAVADKIGLSGPFTDNLVDAMAAVRVLELDEPRPKWQVGDIVAHKASHRPRMIVLDISREPNPVLCHWFDYNGFPQQGPYRPDDLVA